MNMKRLFILAVLTVCSFTSGAQVVFREGYVVNNEGKRIDCLIKDEGWLFNPDKVQYRLSADSPVMTGSVANLSEFEVSGQKYIRAEADIDRSSDNLDNLSTDRMPEFEKRTVFLKELHSGDVSLYEYNKERPLYFYNMGNGIVPLVFKQYMDLEAAKVRTNAAYKEQIKQFPGAANMSASKLATIKYSADDLLKLFEDAKPREKRKVEMAVFAGGGVAAFYYQAKYYTDIIYKNNPCVYAGFEAEYFFPFAAKRLSAAFQPSLQYLQMKGEYEKYNATPGYNEVRLLNLSVPVAIRYNLYLNGSSRLFANAVVGLDMPLYYQYDLFNKEYKPSGALRSAFGLGYRYRHLRAELRYSFGSAHLSWLPSMTNKINIASLNLAYCF